MNPTVITFILVLYFSVLIFIAWLTSRKADTQTFFTANRQSPWYVVAFGMIGSSLSGVTFISVPGNVGKIGFAYFQIVVGYWIGYMVIITVLLPLYYRLNVVSIYTYLEKRFDAWAYRTGSFFFIVSRTVGSSLRLFLTASVLQIFVFDAWGVDFYVTVLITLLLIWTYTYKGGVKTIVWTDSFQTFFLIAAVVISVLSIMQQLHLSAPDVVSLITQDKKLTWFVTEPNAKLFFPKAILGGAFICITMTGMDQEIMQKNLTCRTLGEAQKNMFWFSLLLVVVNLLFLLLGALLYHYADHIQFAIPSQSDELYPRLALYSLGTVTGIFFLLGITASSYASADSALTGLTTCFCIDFLNIEKKPEEIRRAQKRWVHVAFTAVFFLIILLFRELNEKSVLDTVLEVAGYTYGPLLGLFSFGLMTSRHVKGIAVLLVCLLSPIVAYGLSRGIPVWTNGYQIGFEIVLVNGILTWLGLWVISKKQNV